MPRDSGSTSVNTEQTKLDPATVVRCSSKFYSNMQNHATNIKTLLHAVQSQGKTAVVIIADGGPDWNTGSLVLMRLWHDCSLDMLICTSLAAQLSTYNPIEHLWSPLSKRLTSVHRSAVDGEDHTAPCRVAGLSGDRKRQGYLIKLSRSAMYTGKMLHLIHFQLLPCPFHVPLTTVTTTVTMKRCRHCWKVLFVVLQRNLRIVVVSWIFMLKHMDSEVTFRKCDDPFVNTAAPSLFMPQQCLSF